MPLPTVDSSPTLYLTEVFTSIQGETSWAGLPTIFVRLSGCNLRCRWCDTPYSFKRGKPRAISELIGEITTQPQQHICITGGEPLLQPSVYPLIIALLDAGKQVSVETSGAVATDQIDPRARVILDIKCPGSGESEKNIWENLAHLRNHDEVKFVVADEADYVWAKGICEQYDLWNRGLPPLLSPVWNEMDLEQLSAWIIRDDLPCRLNLQLHKVIWGAEAQGK